MRILTLNTWKCDGNYIHRLHLIADMLRESDADIITLQEVFACDSTGDSTAHFLAGHLKFNLFFSPGRYKFRHYNGESRFSVSGLAILTPGSICGYQISLPDIPEDKDRFAQISQIIINNKLMHIVNIHLTHLNNAPNLRYMQLKTLFQALKSKGIEDAIICGDFNATFSHAELQQAFLESDYIIQDTWVLGNGKEPRNSLLKQFDNNKGNRCVDYILYATKKPGQLKISGTEVVGAVSDKDGIYPSDHCGYSVYIDTL